MLLVRSQNFKSWPCELLFSTLIKSSICRMLIINYVTSNVNVNGCHSIWLKIVVQHSYYDWKFHSSKQNSNYKICFCFSCFLQRIVLYFSLHWSPELPREKQDKSRLVYPLLVHVPQLLYGFVTHARMTRSFFFFKRILAEHFESWNIVLGFKVKNVTNFWYWACLSYWEQSATFLRLVCASS